MKGKIVIAVLIAGLVITATTAAVWIKLSQPAAIGEYLPIAELGKLCDGRCGHTMACEGQAIKVWGYFDADYIYDQRFDIFPAQDVYRVWDKALGIYPPQNAQGQEMLDKLRQMQGQPAQKVFITGVIRASDTPFNFNCSRQAYIEITGMSDVYFGPPPQSGNAAP